MTDKNTISTHVLDTGVGQPARGIFVVLEQVESNGSATPVGSGTTDADGRVPDLLFAGGSLDQGVYRLRFATGPYFAAARRPSFYPEVSVQFVVGSGAQHYHVPLLLNSFGYTTYRGS